MGIFNIILNLILFLIIIFGAFYLYQQLPGEEISMKIKNLDTLAFQNNIHPTVNASENVEQFFPNMRFSSNYITFFINSECNQEKAERMKKAFSIVSEETDILIFTNQSEEKADILVGCSFDSYEAEKNVFIAGEGGPTKILNLSTFNLILRGKIILYNESSCEYPITELHELFHVLGFDHINNSQTIMYPYVNCNQKIDTELIQKIKDIYSIEAKAELFFTNISATKKGAYLDFDAFIVNEGIVKAEKVYLEVYSGINKIKEFEFGNLDPGLSKGFSVEDLKLPSRNIESIEFIITSQTPEYENKNNMAELSI